MWSRVSNTTTEALEDALYTTRSLWRIHAMRRTLWVADANDAALLHQDAGAKVAVAERRRLRKWLNQLTDTPDAWLAATEAEVLAAVRDQAAVSTRALQQAVPALREFAEEAPDLIDKTKAFRGIAICGLWLQIQSTAT